VVIQVFRQFIKTVLKVAHNRKLKTVAIQAVRKSGLGFPTDVVASCMLSECDTFSTKHSQSQTTLTEVRFVVFQTDQPTFNVRWTMPFHNTDNDNNNWKTWAVTPVAAKPAESEPTVWCILFHAKVRLDQYMPSPMRCENHQKLRYLFTKFSSLGLLYPPPSPIMSNCHARFSHAKQLLKTLCPVMLALLANVNVHVHVRYMLSPVLLLSVCLSVVCNVCAPYSTGWNFPQCLYVIWYIGHPLTSTKNFTYIAIVTMVTVNVGSETNITVTLRHGRRKRSNLALMGLR